MGEIHDLQTEHQIWVHHNFPNQQVWEPLLGLQEELGELSHAYLKFVQGIRGNDHRNEMYDAVGDLFIYLMSFCNAAGFELETCIMRAWGLVKQRDWRADPVSGGE